MQVFSISPKFTQQGMKVWSSDQNNSRYMMFFIILDGLDIKLQQDTFILRTPNKLVKISGNFLTVAPRIIYWWERIDVI